MHLGVNISNALQQLESVKAAVDQSDDPKLKAATNDDLNMLINLLESPILKSIATLHDSVGMLATQVAHHPSIIPGDFDITPAGDLALQARNLYGGHEGEEEQRVPQVSPPHSLEFGSSSDNERILGLDSGSVDSNMSPKQTRGLLDLSRTDESLGSMSHSIVGSDWAQVEIINLVNDGTGLGFGIIGARTSGVIVKTILAGGVADRDGRLKSGDHILQIGDAHLMEMGSEQVAGVLRASGSRVRLVVARAADPAAPPVHAAHAHHPAPLVPARLLSDPEALDRYLLDAGFEQVFHTQPTPVPHNSGDHILQIGDAEIQSIKSSYVTQEQLEKVKEDCNLIHAAQSCLTTTINMEKAHSYRDELNCHEDVSKCEAILNPSKNVEPKQNRINKNQPEGSVETQRQTVSRYECYDRERRSMFDKDGAPTSQLPLSVNGTCEQLIASTTIEKPSYANVVKTNEGDEGFTLVQHRKKRPTRRFMGKLGCVIVDSDEKFKAADKKIPMFISNVHRETSELDIANYILKKTGEVVNLEKISIRRKCEHNAYKFYVSQNKMSIYLDDKLWPQGIVFRRFAQYRPKRIVNEASYASIGTSSLHNG
ncbi:hypothetical protein B5X24_HaOG216811 [Helicoverpa armigera]|nr:hypothetical protein B5X24_HaOG216811 [Helicoverpa armigera]